MQEYSNLSYEDPYIHVFLDPDNPDGDDIAFRCKKENWIKILTFLNKNCESVIPE